MAFWNRNKRNMVDEAVLDLISLNPHTTGQLVTILEVPNFRIKAATRRLQRSGNIKVAATSKDGQNTFTTTVSR